MPTACDAIVVGSGACGGWAAMELCQAGLKVLMLEAGAHVDPATDFRHTFLYEMDYRGEGRPGLLRRYVGSERNYRIMLDNHENGRQTPDAHHDGAERARVRSPAGDREGAKGLI